MGRPYNVNGDNCLSQTLQLNTLVSTLDRVQRVQSLLVRQNRQCNSQNRRIYMRGKKSIISNMIISFLITIVSILCYTSIASASNIVPNGDIETSASGWSLVPNTVRTSASAQSGSYSLLAANLVQSNSNYTVNGVNPNTTYTFSFWYNSSLTNGMRVNWCDADSNGSWINIDAHNGSVPNNSAGWKNSTITFTTQPNTAQIVIRIISDCTQSGFCYFDNFQINQLNNVITTTSGNGSGIISTSGYANYGDTDTLTAAPSTGSTFISWTSGGSIVSSSPTYTTPSITADVTYTANFMINPPSPPVNLQSLAITSTSATISWAPVANAIQYKVYVGETLVGTSSGTYYCSAMLRPSLEYSFTISTVSTNGEGLQSQPLVITTLGSQLKATQIISIVLVSTDGTQYYDTKTNSIQQFNLPKVVGQSDLNTFKNQPYVLSK